MPSIKTVDFVTFPLSAGGSVSSISPGLWGYPAQKSALLRPALLSSHPDGKGSQLRPVECLLALTSGRLGAPPPKWFVSVTEKRVFPLWFESPCSPMDDRQESGWVKTAGVSLNGMLIDGGKRL